MLRPETARRRRFGSGHCAGVVPALRAQAEENKVTSVYTEIDLPLAPVLYRMEQAGVRIDKDVLAEPSSRVLPRRSNA